MVEEPSSNQESRRIETPHVGEPEMLPHGGPPADRIPLERVIDDLDSRQEWGEWSVDEMARGRTAEDVAAELVAYGWSEDDAAEMAESARRQTRHLRGVITRDEVARANASRYHKATALSWFTAFLSIASFWRLLNSLAFLLASRRPHQTAPKGFEVVPGEAAAAHSPPHAASGADLSSNQQVLSTLDDNPPRS